MKNQLEELVSLEQFVRIRRQAIVFAVAKELYERLQAQEYWSLQESGNEVWVEIASLSQLRRIVGGRFATVKQYWSAAGLPLRSHRGDRSEIVTYDREGWLELSLWLERLGFESRIVKERPDVCFELRKKTETATSEQN